MLRTSTSRRTGAVAAIVALALVAAACGGDDDADDSSEANVADESGDDAPDDNTTADGDGDADEAGDDRGDAGDGSDDAGDDAPVEGEVVEDVVEVDDDPVPGGTLRYGVEADVIGLNPTGSALAAAGQLMANAVFDTLAAFDVDGNAVPYLAESIEPVDGDFSRWRVTVRDGVTFHDGTPLDAEAVRVNFETQLANPLVGLAVAPYFPAEGAVAVIDDVTVEFTMLEPNAVFPALLTSQLGMVASPAWLADAADDGTLNQSPVGTGPFVFDSRAEDSVTRFVRNDDWWGGEVYLDAVEFLPVPDPASRNDLLFGGDIEALHTTDPAAVGDLQDDDDVQNVIDETGEEQFVMLNSAAPPFDDVRARQALALATPLQNFRDLIGLGVARGADQMFIPESRFYNPDVVQEGDDPSAAVALAAEYCADVPENCSDGKIDMTYQFPAGSVVQSRMADILAGGWSEAFNVNYDELVQDVYVRQVFFGDYQAALWRNFGGPEPVANRHTMMCRTIGAISLNSPRFCSEARDALILEAQAQEDPAARAELWQQVVQDMHDAYTYVFLQHTIWDNAFAPEVRGVCDRTTPEGVALQCAVSGRTWHDSVWLAE